MAINSASFRDPSGYVLEEGSRVYRVILPHYGEEWRAVRASGLLAGAPGLLESRELEKGAYPCGTPAEAVAVLESPALPFISYPYEWSFHQLKDAALLTLDLQLFALERGFTLKDASAFNVQFHSGKPVFIDLLSFERARPGEPWEAYGQFCSHFLAPLSLMSHVDGRLGRMSREWIQGIPLDVAARLLPLKTRFSPGLAMHVHLHAAMRERFAETGKKSRTRKKKALAPGQLKDVIASLRNTVTRLPAPQRKTEWGEYYSDTNYSAAAAERKKSVVQELARRNPGSLALDMGANIGEFSRLLAPHFGLVLATDLDHQAIDRHWLNLGAPNILPLILDMADPTPAIGWNGAERRSFKERCQADFIAALAIVHHLRITAGVPLRQMAAGLSELLKPGGKALVEFVPKDDSQVERLLSRREDIFADYTREAFAAAFEDAGFSLEQSFDLPETHRTLLLYRKGRSS